MYIFFRHLVMIVAILVLASAQPLHAQSPTRITELTSEELEIVSGICQKVLKEYFGDSIVAWYNTTYHYLPTNDRDRFQDPSEQIKLDPPISLPSVSVSFAYHRGDSIKADLKERVRELVAEASGKRYHIVKSLVLISPGAGGGSIGHSLDTVAIVPFLTEIF